jgi:SAM-dependent methyltransferase
VNLEPTVAYYRDKLAEHGPGARGMDWKDETSQRLRFEVISRYIDFTRNPSILDVGCGAGAFLDFCRELGRKVNYLGIDVCPEMVAACRNRHGDASARPEYFHENIGAMFRVCRIATIVNMMTCFVDYRYDRLYYATPDEVGKLAIDDLKTRRFLIDHNYPLYEMTAVFYRSY